MTTNFSLLLGTIFERNSAVVFFYVLSGFVLGESLRRNYHIRAFLGRRLARLAPVFWASIALGILAALALRRPTIAGASPWFNYFLSVSIAPAAVAQNVFGISYSINGVLWSIQTEAVMAPILLVLVPLSDRLSLSVNLCAAALLLAVTDTSFLAFGMSHAYARPFSYLYAFYLGVLIPRILGAPSIARYLRNGKVLAAGLLLVACLHLLIMADVTSPENKLIFDAIVSVQIIGYVVSSSEIGAILKGPLLVRLGDISYSFYAFGQIILTACAYLLFRLSSSPWWLPHPALFTVLTLFIAMPVAISLAIASYHLVERPGIAIGNRLTRKMRVSPDTEASKPVMIPSN